MAKDFRCTFFMNQGNIGFSETYWKSANTHNEAIIAAADLWRFRNTLTSRYTLLQAIRVSVEGERRNSQLYTPGIKYLPGLNTPVNIESEGDLPYDDYENPNDQTRSCLHLGFNKGGKRLALRYLAAIPDTIVRAETATAQPTRHPVWYSHFLNWVQIINQNGWALKVKRGDDLNPRRPVIKWLLRQVAPSILGAQMALQNSFNPSVGDKVTVNGVKMNYDGLRSPNGQWYVDEVSTDDGSNTRTVWLRTATNFDPDTIRVLGNIRALQYEYLVPDLITIIRAGVHKRGKVFGSPRGRVKRPRYSN